MQDVIEFYLFTDELHSVFLFLAGSFPFSLTSLCYFIPMELKVYMKHLREIFWIFIVCDC